MKRGAGALVLLAVVSLLMAVPSAAQPSGTMTWGIHVTLATPGNLNAPSLAESWTMSKDGRTWEDLKP